MKITKEILELAKSNHACPGGLDWTGALTTRVLQHTHQKTRLAQGPKYACNN